MDRRERDEKISGDDAGGSEDYQIFNVGGVTEADREIVVLLFFLIFYEVLLIHTTDVWHIADEAAEDFDMIVDGENNFNLAEALINDNETESDFDDHLMQD